MTAEPAAEHFPGCHPEDAEDTRELPDGYRPQAVEKCWHCDTPTPQGCYCPSCLDADAYISAGAVYHCPTCKRWWATLTVTRITFGADQ